MIKLKFPDYNNGFGIENVFEIINLLFWKTKADHFLDKIIHNSSTVNEEI